MILREWVMEILMNTPSYRKARTHPEKKWQWISSLFFITQSFFTFQIHVASILALMVPHVDQMELIFPVPALLVLAANNACKVKENTVENYIHVHHYHIKNKVNKP